LPRLGDLRDASAAFRPTARALLRLRLAGKEEAACGLWLRGGVARSANG
jgi:hypothetical protein